MLHDADTCDPLPKNASITPTIVLSLIVIEDAESTEIDDGMLKLITYPPDEVKKGAVCR